MAYTLVMPCLTMAADSTYNQAGLLCITVIKPVNLHSYRRDLHI
jgi:ABC-type transporter Mla maintaining outer membrane lipid asymmetry permease subunit MlaE